VPSSGSVVPTGVMTLICCSVMKAVIGKLSRRVLAVSVWPVSWLTVDSRSRSCMMRSSALSIALGRLATKLVSV
jgi:hypothetical protein